VPRLRSALAEAEVEYEERTRRRIDVRFEVVDRADLARRCGLVALPPGRASIRDLDHDALTLPANQAVALHPDFDYSLLAVDSADGAELLVLASELAESCWNAPVPLCNARLPGSRRRARGTRAAPPVLRARSAVILGDHVTLDSGTGAVHTGARSRQEDFVIGQRYGLAVDNRWVATGDSDVDALFAGEKVFDANKHVVEVLGERVRCCTTSRSATATALLAAQVAGDLPRDAAVVHQHGAGGLRAAALEKSARCTGCPTGASSASPA